MSYDNFVMSDQHARDRHNEILKEVAQIRLANQVAKQRPVRPGRPRSIQSLVAALLVALQR